MTKLMKSSPLGRYIRLIADHQQHRAGQQQEGLMAQLEDIFAGRLELTARERAFIQEDDDRPNWSVRFPTPIGGLSLAESFRRAELDTLDNLTDPDAG